MVGLLQIIELITNECLIIKGFEVELALLNSHAEIVAGSIHFFTFHRNDAQVVQRLIIVAVWLNGQFQTHLSQLIFARTNEHLFIKAYKKILRGLYCTKYLTSLLCLLLIAMLVRKNLQIYHTDRHNNSIKPSCYIFLNYAPY